VELSWQRAEIHADYWVEADHMSESDWRLAGCPFAEPDDICLEAIEELEYLLSEDGPLWGDLLRQARQLIVDARSPGFAPGRAARPSARPTIWRRSAGWVVCSGDLPSICDARGRLRGGDFQEQAEV